MNKDRNYETTALFRSNVSWLFEAEEKKMKNMWRLKDRLTNTHLKEDNYSIDIQWSEKIIPASFDMTLGSPELYYQF